VDFVAGAHGRCRERLYVGGGGVGLDVEASRYAGGRYRANAWSTALRRVGGASVDGFVPLEVRAEFPGSEQSAMEAMVLLAGVLNAPSYGAGLRIAPGARVDDGWLNLSFVRRLNALEF